MLFMSFFLLVLVLTIVPKIYVKWYKTTTDYQLEECMSLLVDPVEKSKFDEKINTSVTKYSKTQQLSICKQILQSFDRNSLAKTSKILDMNIARGEGQFSYVFENGKVLIAGGDNFSHTSIEMFDPINKEFKVIKKNVPIFLSDTSILFTAKFIKITKNETLLGKYILNQNNSLLKKTKRYSIPSELVKNNCCSRIKKVFDDGTVLYQQNCDITQSCNNNFTYNSVFLLNPFKNNESELGVFKEKKSDFGSLKLQDNKVLLLGGKIFDNKTNKTITLKSINSYDPVIGNIKKIGNMKVARKNPKTILLNSNQVFIASTDNSLLEIFDLKTNKSEIVGDLKDFTLNDNQGLGCKEIFLVPEKNVVFLVFDSLCIVFNLKEKKLYKLTNIASRYCYQHFTPIGKGEILITGGNYVNSLSKKSKRAIILSLD